MPIYLPGVSFNDFVWANSAAGINHPQVRFDYIHNNPVKAKLAQHPLDWEYSSFRDYAGLRNGKLINKAIASSFGLHW